MTWELVLVKRDWVPEWLYKLFCPRLGTYQPFRWILHRKPDDITKARADRGGR